MTQADRDMKALEAAQQLPCGMCGAVQRLRGDHLCARCRHNVNETRRLAGIDIEKEVGR